MYRDICTYTDIYKLHMYMHTCTTVVHVVHVHVIIHAHTCTYM